MAIAQALQVGVENAIRTYATDTSATLAGSLLPVALTGVTIYLIIIGFAIARGEVQDSMSAIVQKVFKISFICAIALGGGAYQSIVIDGINGIEGVFTNAIGGQQTIGALIDRSIVPMETITGELYKKANEPFIPNMALVVAAALCTIGQVLVTLTTLAPLLVAKITVAVLLAIGPAFIVLAIWPATQRLTEAWLTATLAAVVTVVVIAAVIGFLPRFLQDYATRVLRNINTTNVVQDVVSLILVIVVMGWIGWKSADLGGSIVGGATLGHPGQMVAQTIMKMLTRNKDKQDGGGKGPKNSLSGSSSMGDKAQAAARGSGTSLAHQNVITNLNRRS